MTLPLTTPCAHNFCKSCLEGKFAGQTFTKERSRGGRTLRSQKNVMNCPECSNDISDFLQNPQVNREIMDVIEKLQESTKEEAHSSEEVLEASSVEKENEVSNPRAEGKIEGTRKRKEAESEEKIDEESKTKIKKVNEADG